MSRLMHAYAGLPRAGKWGLWALGVVLFSLYAVVPMIDRINELNGRANVKVLSLQLYEKEMPARKSADQSASNGVAKFGMIDPPGEAAARSDAFNKRVTKILQAHEVRMPRITTREVPLGAGPLTAAMPVDQKVERLGNQIQFDATPEQVMQVIADLEKSPEVTAVTQVQITVPTGGDKTERLVRATIAAEVWQIKKKGKAR